MKKISCLLCVCMILSLSSVAYAASLPSVVTDVLIYDISDDIWNYLIDYLDNFRDDLTNYNASDLSEDMVRWSVSQFVATEEHFDDIVDYIMAHPDDFPMSLRWTPSLNLFEVNDVSNEFYVHLADYINSTFITQDDISTSIYAYGIPAGGYMGTYIQNLCPFPIYLIPSTSSQYCYVMTYEDWATVNSYRGNILRFSRDGSGLDGTFSYVSYANSPAVKYSDYGYFGEYGALLGSYAYNFLSNEGYVKFSNSYSAAQAFYGSIVPPSAGEPDGSVYIRPYLPINTNLPSIINNNYDDISEYYYTTYGDTFEDGDISYNEYYIAYNTVNYEYSFDVPYWLVNGEKAPIIWPDTPLYTIDLPSVDTVDHGTFWQDLYLSLPNDFIIYLGVVFLCLLIFLLI